MCHLSCVAVLRTVCCSSPRSQRLRSTAPSCSLRSVAMARMLVCRCSHTKQLASRGRLIFSCLYVCVCACVCGQGQLWSTYSQIGFYRWFHVFGAEMVAEYDFTPADLGAALSGAPVDKLVAYTYARLWHHAIPCCGSRWHTWLACLSRWCVDTQPAYIIAVCGGHEDWTLLGVIAAGSAGVWPCGLPAVPHRAAVLIWLDAAGRARQVGSRVAGTFPERPARAHRHHAPAGRRCGRGGARVFRGSELQGDVCGRRHPAQRQGHGVSTHS